jgi:DNA-binding MarR family transcriptional regulator
MSKSTKTAAPETVALADGLRPVLLRLSRELRREARAAGVPAGDVGLLVAIKYSPGIGVKELAERERISSAAISKHVERLVKQGLVTREASPEDRRRVGLALTEAGRRILRNVRSRRTVWLAQRLQKLSADERAAVEAALEPLTLLLDEEERP